ARAQRRRSERHRDHRRRLARVKDCKALSLLYLRGTKVTDAGLAHFKGRKHLSLDLGDTAGTDAGIAHPKDCPAPGNLGLRSTKVTEASFEMLAGFPLLERLDLRAVKVPEASVKKLAAAVPQCRILWGEADIKPTAPLDPDRRAALYTLAVGGSVRVSGT